MPDKKLITIYSANTEIDAAMVQNLLTNSGIRSFIKDNIIGTLAPYLTTPGGAGAVKIVINQKDEEKAKQVFKDNNIK